MHEPSSHLHFLGDLDDPWVAAIANALPPRAQRHHVPATLQPLDPQQLRHRLDSWIIHRSSLLPADLDWLRRAHEHSLGRVFLLVGPHVRFHQLQRCLPWVHAIEPETTPLEAIESWLEDSPTPARTNLEVAVAGSNRELRLMFADALRAAGFDARASDQPPWGCPEPLVVWEAPVLEPDWTGHLRRAARGGARQVVVLLGLAGRELVRQAADSGAMGCLSLPCSPDHLARLLHRLADPPRRRSPRTDSPSRLVAGHHLRPPASRPARMGDGRRPAYDG